MANYFSIVPNVRVGFPGSKDTFDQEYVLMKNFFRRIKADFTKIKSFMSFERYTVPGDEKPYQVSQRIYKTPEYEWIILLVNNITNVYTDWPLSQSEFQDLLRRKYGTRLSDNHHWETKEVIFNGVKIVKPGLIVERTYSVLRPDGQRISGNQLVRPVSNYEYEYEKNEAKRQIYLLDPAVVNRFINEMEKLLSYKFSEDSINDDTKKSGDDDEFYYVKVLDIEGDPQLE
jgi:hypothetical protein